MMVFETALSSQSNRCLARCQLARGHDEDVVVIGGADIASTVPGAEGAGRGDGFEAVEGLDKGGVWVPGYDPVRDLHPMVGCDALGHVRRGKRRGDHVDRDQKR